MTAVPLGELLLIFLRIGNLTFGGGEPTMAALQQELVERRGWLSPERYGLAYALARITPGTNVLAFCAAAAWYVRGWPAALGAVLASTAPSALLTVVLTVLYEEVKGNRAAAGAIAGLLAAAVGMMAAAAWNLVRPRLGHGDRLRTALLAGGSLALLAGLSVPPIPVLALAAAVGAVWPRPAVERPSREPA